MARPRKGVTFDNADYIFWYLKSAYQESRFPQLLQQPEYAERTYEEFQKQSEVPYCLLTDKSSDGLHVGKLGIDPYQLDQWVVAKITPKGWQRILSAFRQHRHARKHLKTSLKLEQDLYWRFSHFARINELSLDEAMQILLDSYEQ